MIGALLRALVALYIVMLVTPFITWLYIEVRDDFIPQLFPGNSTPGTIVDFMQYAETAVYLWPWITFVLILVTTAIIVFRYSLEGREERWSR